VYNKGKGEKNRDTTRLIYGIRTSL